MQLAPLSAARHKIRPGVPLPFNIRNPDGTLLLARGKLIDNVDQVEALEERGAMVEGEESAQQQIRNAPANRLPALWGACMSQVGRTLGSSPPS